MLSSCVDSLWLTSMMPGLHYKLIVLIHRGDWEEILRLICMNADAAQLLYKRRFVPEASAKLPLLSLALWNGMPHRVLKAWLRLLPESCNVEDSRGRLPLHVACIRKCPPAVIDALVEQGERHTLTRDRMGNLPLHYAVLAACRRDIDQCNADATSNIKPSSPSIDIDEHLDVLSSLLAAHPPSALVKNLEFETPISLAHRDDNYRSRRVYAMIQNTSEALRAASKGHASDDLTAASSSHFLDYESSFFLMEDNVDEQAIGERPERRNAVVIFFPTPMPIHH